VNHVHLLLGKKAGTWKYFTASKLQNAAQSLILQHIRKIQTKLLLLKVLDAGAKGVLCKVL
jgi:hypothetical protein